MTIKDIARLSGCGVATVSRVINNYPDVSPETRKRVLEVLEKYNFQPNANARSLKQQSSKRVAIIVKGIQNGLFADMLEHTQRRLQENEVDTAVYYLDEEADEVKFATRLCRDFKPPAVLFLGGDPEHFRSSFDGVAVPCVLLTNSARELGYDNLSSLTTDDGLAAEQAVDHLVSRGHRRIGVLGGGRAAGVQVSSHRVEGCRCSMEKHGLEFDLEKQVEPCRFSLEGAYTAVGYLMDRCPDLTAIFALSDVMALGAIRALHDRGLRVPEDVSVMGCDGISVGRYLVPRLTTIRQDTEQMAVQGADLLLRMLNDGCPPTHAYIPFTLLEGESVGICRSAE